MEKRDAVVEALVRCRKEVKDLGLEVVVVGEVESSEILFSPPPPLALEP